MKTTTVAVLGEARQQRAPWLFLAAFASTWLLDTDASVRNVDLWIDGVRGAGQAIILLAPLAAFAGVWTGARPRDTGTWEFEDSSLRGRVVPTLRPLLIAFLTIGAGFALAVVVRWAQLAVGSTGTAGLWSLAAPAQTMLWIATWVSIGGVLGSVGRFRLIAAPALALVAWSWPVVASSFSTDLAGLTPNIWDIWQPQGTWDPAAIVTSLLWSVAVTGSATLAVILRADRSLKAGVGLATALLVATVFGVRAAEPGSWRPIADAGVGGGTSVNLVCQTTSEAIRVCVHEAYEGVLDDLIAGLEPALREADPEVTTVRLDAGPGQVAIRASDTTVTAGLSIVDSRVVVDDFLLESLARAVEG